MSLLPIIVSGQSNMVGSGPGGPDFATVDGRILFWNNANGDGGDGNAFVQPVMGQKPFSTTNPPSNNIAPWFAQKAAVARLADEIKLVEVARYGTPIAWWTDGTATLYAAMLRIWRLTGLPPAAIFLWHQGENDAYVAPDHPQMPPATYVGKFLGLRTRMIGDGILAHDAITIVGGICEGGYASQVTWNAATYGVLAAQPKIAYAHSTGLPNIGDATHFTGQALADLGARYWDAYVGKP